MGYASSPLASLLNSLHEAHRNFENIPTCPSLNTWNSIPHQGVGGALIDLCVALLRIQVFQKIWIPIKIWVKSDRYRDWKLFGRHISYKDVSCDSQEMILHVIIREYFHRFAEKIRKLLTKHQTPESIHWHLDCFPMFWNGILNVTVSLQHKRHGNNISAGLWCLWSPNGQSLVVALEKQIRDSLWCWESKFPVRCVFYKGFYYPII